ncbi:glycosyltransferase [soil metagenome]
MPPKYSIIVPVYNRPQELEELLRSLTDQTVKDFEVVIVEDGSEVTSDKIVADFSSHLSIQYFSKTNSGPGPSRNEGFKKALGQYFVVFDSDCIIPTSYFESVEKYLAANPLDAWGGPDKGHEKFTPLQRAMAFTMSSFLTTGGIRGGKEVGFQPRSFNMGLSRAVIEKTGGFKFDRLAEDIELSIRMRKEGFRVALIPDAYVYHKRRTSLLQFYSQVEGFGRGRVRVGKIHEGFVKITHWFPTMFLIGLPVTVLAFIFNQQLGVVAVAFYLIYLLGIFIDALRMTKSFSIALLSIPSALVQLIGYGVGFLKEKFGTSNRT